MGFELELREFVFGDKVVKLNVPKEEYVKSNYSIVKDSTSTTPFPYWAKVWPAAVGLGSFIQKYPSYVINKEILELAAGLGLPSIVAASYAQSVCVSDYQSEALIAIDKSILINRLNNVFTRLLDWNQLPAGISCDVLLLSDINYYPADFLILEKVLKSFLKKGITIILSTPQRLMAKPFIAPLLPYCIQSSEIEVYLNEATTMVSIFVLNDKGEKPSSTLA
jgi:predicted nicotinamide N-methyase